MIDDSYLYQALADWCTGRRPASGPRPSASYATPDEVEKVASAVMVDEAQSYEQLRYEQLRYEQQGNARQGYDQQGYEQPDPAYASAEGEEVAFEDAEEDVAIEDADAAESEDDPDRH